MNDDEFWSLIRLVDQDSLARGEGHDVAAVEPVRQALAERTPDAIRHFADRLAQALYDLDGMVYADESGASAVSAEGFLYARAYVVARGRDHYEAVKADPTLMPKTLDEWCEPLVHVAGRAWEEATDEPWEHVTPVSVRTGSNEANWP